MKKIVSIMAAFIFILTGCAGAETDKENAAVPTETTVSANNSEAPIAERQNDTMENMPATDDKGTAAAQGGKEAALPPNFEALTAPPTLAVSTLNNVDRVIASCGNSQWRCTLPDGTATTLNACGAHPLDQQEHPILYTAFPAGSLPPLEDGENLGLIVPVFYLDFGEILPETVSVIRWPASYIGNTQKHTDFEEVIAEIEGDTITLMPLGDGDYVYEVSARWGDVGYAIYTFRTLPQIREEQKDELTGIFDALNELNYQPYTCDGLPEYRLTATDGTVYAINLSEKWVWRGNGEQAELSDEFVDEFHLSSFLMKYRIGGVIE